MNVDTYDFSLQELSPAIGAGTILDTLFTDDFLSIIRIGSWNIGAYTGIVVVDPDPEPEPTTAKTIIRMDSKTNIRID